MPMKKKYTRRPRRVARKSKRTYRKKATTNSTRSMNKDNYARISSITPIPITIDTNTATAFQFALNNAPARVLNVAKAYQEFKIDYVEFRFKPYYDTYTTGTSAPQLYHQIIKDPSVQDIADVAQFRQNGINPMSLAKDGNKVWRYKPAINIAYAEAPVSSPNIVLGGMIKVSPWLDTEATNSSAASPLYNGAPHYGSVLYVESTTPAPAPIASLDIEVHYVFRKPRSDATSPTMNGRMVNL